MESTEDHKNKKFDQMIGKKRVHLLPLQMEGGNPKAMESTTEFYQRKEVCY
jgi:hypothetical protein